MKLSANPYDRFPDGRPKVPDELLDKVKSLVIEEAYGAVRAKRRIGRLRNQTVIDMLGPNDVIVVDLFGKTDGAPSSAISGAGMVIDGGCSGWAKLSLRGCPRIIAGRAPTRSAR